MGEFNPKPCQKSDQGTVAGTNIGEDEKIARDNWETWGDDSVCRDESTKDFYVLRSAVNLGIKGKNSLTLDDLRENVTTLKGKADGMRDSISELRAGIEKSEKTLKELGGFTLDPVVGFSLQVLGSALAFGLLTTVVEDMRMSSIMNDPQLREMEFLKRKDKYLRSKGCSPTFDVKKEQAKIDLKRAAIAAAVVGGIAAINAALRDDEKIEKKPVEEKRPLPDLSHMKEADLKSLYQSLLAEYEDLGRTKTELVNKKTAIENQIAQKGGGKDTWLDKIFGNTWFRLAADAAAAFGLGATIFRDRYQTYSDFHSKVEEKSNKLDEEVQQEADKEIAGGKCGEEKKITESADVEESQEEVGDLEEAPPPPMMNSIQPDTGTYEEAYEEWEAGPHEPNYDAIYGVLFTAALLAGPAVLLAAPEAAAVGGAGAAVETAAVTAPAAVSLAEVPAWLTAGATVANDVALPLAMAAGFGGIFYMPALNITEPPPSQ